MTQDQIAQLVIALLGALGIGAFVTRWLMSRTPQGKAETEVIMAQADLTESQASLNESQSMAVLKDITLSLVKPLSDRLLQVEEKLRDYIQENAELRYKISEQNLQMDVMRKRIDDLEVENTKLEKTIEQQRKRIRELEKG